MPMIPEERFKKWILGVPFFVAFGLLLATALHFGRGITWAQLAPVCCLFIGVQVGFFLGSFWLRKLGRDQGNWGPAAALTGFYAWSSGLLIMYYGGKWRLLPALEMHDCVVFSILIALMAGVCFAVSTLAKKRGGPTSL